MKKIGTMEELSKIENEIIQLLKAGNSQKEIAAELKKMKGLNAYSVSTVEKIIQALKKRYQVKSMFQLGMVIERIGG